LRWASGDAFQVHRSSKDGAIRPGEDWRAWIDKNIVDCDFGIVILTPGSFRTRWVLWEAGAVAGVQYERQRSSAGDEAAARRPRDPRDLGARRVRVVRFGLGTADLGPFGSSQSVDGLREQSVSAFVEDLLLEHEDKIKKEHYNEALKGLTRKSQEFVSGAQEDLKHSPIQPTEGLIQVWADRLEKALRARNYRWAVAAKRWVNVAFLGAANADEVETIDFRLHALFAEAHRRLGQWAEASEQLRLAIAVSPNDLVLLRDLGRTHLERSEENRAAEVMEQMQALDASVFKQDREGIALRCRYFAQLEDWERVIKLIEDADAALVNGDAYLCNWRAVATMKALGSAAAAARFRQLKGLLEETGRGFWDDATLVNALLALGDFDEATEVLRRMELDKVSLDQRDSATRFYDEIVRAFGHSFDWRQALDRARA
jgi:pentatricopeptide repeat protein